jgi:DNA-binding NarL/FixJ family response regulator
MIRVFLADDHSLVRAGMRALLAQLPGVEVVAECGDGREAVAAVVAHRPDIAFLDISMPGLNGLEAAARIAQEAPATRVVILTMHAGESHIEQALEAGVAGYILKDAEADELPILLRSVMRGDTYLSPGISKRVVVSLRTRLAQEDRGTAADPLTARQREILQLLAEGKTAKEIAHLLRVSAKTVEAHRAQIMARLDIHDVPGLVRYAIRIGLITSDG